MRYTYMYLHVHMGLGQKATPLTSLGCALLDKKRSLEFVPKTITCSWCQTLLRTCTQIVYHSEQSALWVDTRNALGCLLQSMQTIWKPRSYFTGKWWCMDHKAIPKLERGSAKMKAHASSESHVRYLEAELIHVAKKGGSIAHHLQHNNESKTEMPSSPFFDVLIFFAGSTFLTRLILIS